MADILEEIMKFIPDKSKISDSYFEGANIVLYTKDREFLLDNNGIIKAIVDAIKKRVELRPDPAITMEIESAEKTIREIIPKEAGEINVLFDTQRSLVTIEVEKPGIAIGKQGEILKEVKKKTFWVPIIRRTPPIRSKIIENINHVLYENSDYRKKFLNKVGKRIYGGWTKGRVDEWVRVSFLGAGRQVGRSCLFLQTPESKILMDCGINVAAQSNEEMFPLLEAPEFKIEELDAVIISHSHVDHVAFLPYLYKMGFTGPTYMTLPTRDIAALLCLDIINIAQKEANKPIYSSTDIKNMVKHTISLDYGEVTDITPDVRLTFYDAGHKLGSALCHLHIGNGLHNLVYTGDFLYENSNLLSAACTRFPRLETIIMESTYGGKKDTPPTRRECELFFTDIIKKTLDRGGKVLVPVLGSGRAQEIMVILDKLVKEGTLPKIPVYVQGLVWDITAIHTAYPDFFNSRVKKMIYHKDENPFLNEMFMRVGSRKEMQDVVEEKGPCVILATSGMLTGGSSLEYFKMLADNPKNAIVLTCYQGPGSIGRRLEDGEKKINFVSGNRQEVHDVNLDVHVIHGFSGHSNRTQIMNFVHNLDPRPKKIILVHGESSKCLELASDLHKMLRIETLAPKNLEAVRLR